MIFEKGVLLETNLVDDKNKSSFLFSEPEDELVFNVGDDVVDFFNKIEEYRVQGKYLAGYFTYEFGFFLESAFKDIVKESCFDEPLVWLGVFSKTLVPKKERTENISINNLSFNKLIPSLNYSNYLSAFSKIKEELLAGNSYQINFTFKEKFKVNVSSYELYKKLCKHQPTAYNAYIKDGRKTILSFSPELFFHRKGNEILVKPMKGTRTRGQNKAEDNALRNELAVHKKDRAENVMIVDLLRNDLGRISTKGSVTAKSLFDIEEHSTVFQMTSSISSQLKKGVKWLDIFKSLFPCGSVTGAPKISSMKIIKDLEEGSRGVYCGAIGYIGPNNDACFNVAIRTIEVKDKIAVMGIGSGVVVDSEPENEYQECLDKAKFLRGIM